MIKRTFAVSAVSFCLVGAAFAGSLGLAACSGDDDAVSPNVDGSVLDTDGSSATTDGGSIGGGWLLATSGSTSSELVALNLNTNQIDGRLTFAGSFGAPTNGGADAFLLEQKVDIVGRLQTDAPWNLASTWNVGGTDGPESGAAYADPDGTVVTAGTKAYVVRYTRNAIDVIDPSQTVDAGSPTKSIDISSFAQAGDTDGAVEATGAFFDSTRNRLWVVLENIDRLSYPLPCSTLKATLIAIDTTSDMVVALGGSGPGGGYAFTLVDPLGVVYDPEGDRVITTDFGCQANGDGGASGPVLSAGLELMSLKDGTSSVILNDGTKGRGGALALTGATSVLAVFSDPTTFASTGYEVDLASKAVTGTLAAASLPDAFVSDGAGNLYGTLGRMVDGGTIEDLVQVDVSSGKVTTLAAAPFRDPSGFVGGVALWKNPVRGLPQRR